MKGYGIPLQYACFECRKSFKRKHFSADYSPLMTSEQVAAEQQKAEKFNKNKIYKCPDCGKEACFMGQDFKAPKRTNIKGWQKAKERIESGKIFYRGT